MTYFRSERLEYSKYTAEEYALYHTLSSDEQVMQYIMGRPLTAAETKKRFQKILEINKRKALPGVFAVRILGTKDYVGLAKATVFAEGEIEIGYAMMPVYWGKGLGFEISETMLNYSRTIKNTKAVIGIIDPINLASKRILEKCGLSYFEDTLLDGLPGAVYKMYL